MNIVSKEASVELLHALAPDHALLLAAMVAGKAKALALRGTTVVVVVPDDDNDEVHRFPAITFDPFGCPILTHELRAELRKALGLATDSLST